MSEIFYFDCLIKIVFFISFWMFSALFFLFPILIKTFINYVNFKWVPIQFQIKANQKWYVHSNLDIHAFDDYKLINRRNAIIWCLNHTMWWILMMFKTLVHTAHMYLSSKWWPSEEGFFR